jgi:hypothetical protein
MKKSNKETTIVYLKNNDMVTIDGEDESLLKKFKWYLSKSKDKKRNYAVTTINGKTIRMHRMIMNCVNSKIDIDHIDHNGLNNKKSNLRLCTRSQNMGNVLKLKYKGVQKRTNIFRAYIDKDYKRIYLGNFNTPEEAANAYNKKAVELFGEFACLNQIFQEGKI